MHRNPFWRYLAALVAVVWLAAFAHGQTNQGQIAGNVLDPSGAAVPDAQITARNEATGAVENTRSTSSGSYRFPSIQLGRYTLTTTAPGFRQEIGSGVEVRVGTTTAFDIKLVTGGTNETVTVDANAPTVEAESSDVGGTVTDRQIVELPLALGGVGAMRSPEAFVFLIPGTVGPGSGNSANGIFISKIGGGQNFGNEVLLDGASQTRSENGSSFDEEALSVEAISEFRVTTSTPAAEFGRTSGGIENFVTKNGTNNYHGTVYGIFQNEALNSNDWFNNGFKALYTAQGNPTLAARFKRPLDRKFDYGLNLGGPVEIPHLYHGKDKTFFFFSWEQFRLTAGGVFQSTVPTLAERTGDFSDRLAAGNGATGATNPCDGTPIVAGQIFDPATTRQVGTDFCRTAFPGNVIPMSRFSPTGQKILAFYPLPTSSNITNSNYSYASSSPLFNTTYTIRIDQNISTKDKVFGSYSTRENTRNNPQNAAFPGPIDYNTQTQDFITHFGRAGWDHIFTPTILNHLNLGYNRSNSINGSIEAASTQNYSATSLGLPFQCCFPRVDVDGYSPLSRNQLGDNVDNGIRVNDAVSWQKGRHNFRFGVDWRYQEYSPLAHDQVNGYLHFTGGETRAGRYGTFANSTGVGLASMLLGLGDYSSSLIPSHLSQWRSNYWAGFVQDDFKISNSLVLNIGLRYDVDQPRREVANATSNFNPTLIDPKSGIPGALEFATTCSGCNPRWADTWKKDFAPRVGFAYSPASLNNKFAVRGGFSTLYAPLLYNDFGGATTVGYNNPVFQQGNGFDPAFNLDGGVATPSAKENLDPAFFDSGNSSAPTPFSNYIKPSYGRPPQVNQWNLQIQQELAKDLILTLGYIGSAGSHLRSALENINNMPRSNFALGDELTRPFATTAPVTGATSPYAKFNTAAPYQQALRPFPQYGYIATDCCLQNVGHSSYEALIASLERRFRAGLNVQASYTWSKDITNADSALPGFNAGVNQEQDPSNSKSQKSLSIQDIPNTFVVSYLYELPFGKGKPFLNFNNPLARSIVSGFELGGVQRYQSGEPLSFGCADGIPGWDNCISFTRLPGASLASPARRNNKLNPFEGFETTLPGPDPNGNSEFNGLLRRDTQPSAKNPVTYSTLQTSPALYSQNAPTNRVLRAKVACLSLPTGAPIPANCDNGDFQFGNVPRVTSEIRNFRYLSEDFSFLKKTPIAEGVMLTLKVELLNAFNRHIFATPDTQPYDANFGVPTGVIDDAGPGAGRVVQLTGRFQF